eukprot:maker-scaffold699_size109694-snap-gene-0.19 protein:Tk03221 transcript:maker-scaffold699_size109694-snap-gene-0.19-mRNA-1 annotation:"glycosyltransferase 8 domain-containing protein 4"
MHTYEYSDGGDGDGDDGAGAKPYPRSELKELQRTIDGIQSAFEKRQPLPTNASESLSPTDQVTIAMVACGSKDRFEEVSIILKSLILFAEVPFKVVIFTDSLQDEITQFLDPIRASGGDFPEFIYEIREPIYPISAVNEVELRSTFQLCASLRLFLPDLLPNVNKILYLDTDIVVLDSLKSIWDHFQLMNSSQITAMAYENQVESLNVYSYAKYPTIKRGLNSGVMLMDLEKMRNSFWIDKTLAIFKTMKHHLLFGDQDIINIYSHFFPETIHILPCTMNFRPDLCLQLDSSCPDVRAGSRVAFLHGNRRAFLEKWQFGGSLPTYLLQVLKWYLINIDMIPYSIHVASTVCQQNVYQSVQHTLTQIHLIPESFSNLKELFVVKLASYDTIELDPCLGILESLIKPFGNYYPVGKRGFRDGLRELLHALETEAALEAAEEGEVEDNNHLKGFFGKHRNIYNVFKRSQGM